YLASGMDVAPAGPAQVHVLVSLLCLQLVEHIEHFDRELESTAGERRRVGNPEVKLVGPPQATLAAPGRRLAVAVEVVRPAVRPDGVEVLVLGFLRVLPHAFLRPAGVEGGCSCDAPLGLKLVYTG